MAALATLRAPPRPEVQAGLRTKVGGSVLVPGATVRRVAVLVVNVIDMTGVLNARVTARLVVLVRSMSCVFAMGHLAHRSFLKSKAPRALPTRSRSGAKSSLVRTGAARS
jgi:hypothetical protein